MWARKQASTIDLSNHSAPAPRADIVDVSESFEVKGDTATLTKTTHQKVKTLADLVRICEIDLDVWDIVEWQCKASQQASVPRAVRPEPGAKWIRPTTEPVLTQMFHVSAKLRRKVALIAARAEVEALIKDAKTRCARRAPAVVRHTNLTTRDAMLELAIPDLHVGKLAWADETGHGHYDTKIAEQRFEAAVDTLIARTAAFRFARVLFVVGNDILNADNAAGTTTQGTPQSTDGRYQKTFSVVRRMIARTIEDRLRALAPEVVGVIVPGNHDTLAAWHLGDSLACWFHKTPGVVIDNAPTQRKYQQFGRTMLMFTHGDKGKPTHYPMLMAAEQPQMWAATDHREAHTGHWHKKSATRFDRQDVEEFNGVVVRVSPALCEPDAWHANNGYVGNARAAQGFVWHRSEGLIATAEYTVQPPVKGGRDARS